MRHLKSVKIRILIVLLTFISILFITQTTNAQEFLSTFKSEMSVQEAIEVQQIKTVEGYIVGEPITSTVVEGENFTGNTVIALASTAKEVDPAKMIYVVLPTNYQTTYGLSSNPNMIGSKIQVQGYIKAYLTHAAVDGVLDITLISPSETGGGHPLDATYYSDAIGLTGEALKASLNTIISGHTEISYDAAKYALRDTDEDPNNPNNVILFYTGRSQAKSSFGGGANDWNREHVWAKSHGDFGTTMGPGSDIHHLRPTDASVNSTRNNKDFDYGGSPVTECIILVCNTDSDSWEPDDSVKGDVARILFYMVVRYEGYNGEVDLELNENVNNGTAPYHGKLSVLLEWHLLDPVSNFERNRNDVIYNDYQHNRNPFIDHPEWVGFIWD